MSDELPADPAAELAADLDNLSGMGASADGLVRVVIDSDGMPSRLDIDPACMRWTPAELSAAVIEALRSAHDDVRGQFTERLQRFPAPEVASGGVAPDMARKVIDAYETALGDFGSARRRLLDALDDA